MRVPRRTAKSILFTLTPAFALGAGATLVLSLLEHRGLIHTARPDDILSFPPPDFVTRQQADGEDFWEIRYARPGDPMAVQQRFPAHKADNTIRIVLTGGSFAMGDPYVDPARPSPGFGGIADWVRAELSARLRPIHVEVINASLGGTNSTGVREIVEQLGVTDPDIVVVITGNNDGHVFPTPWNRWLNHWIVYRALKKALLPPPPSRPRFAPQDADVEAIRANFRANIRRIIEVAEERGFHLILGTLPINYRYEVSAGVPSSSAGAPEGSHAPATEESCNRLLATPTRTAAPPDLLRKGRCLEKLRRFSEALETYSAYVESMPLGRTRPSLNEIVRALARTSHVPLLDMERIANEQSATGIAERELFFDNCHLLWRGYAMMARSAVDLMLDKGLLDKAKKQPGPRPTVGEMVQANRWQALYTFRPQPIPYTGPGPVLEQGPAEASR